MLSYKDLNTLQNYCDTLSIVEIRRLLDKLIHEYCQYKQSGSPEDCAQRKEWMKMSYEDIRNRFNDIVYDLLNEKDYIPPSFYKILRKHSESFMKGLADGLKTSENFQKLDEDVTKLEKLSGYSLDKLLEMFATGWTLEPPEKNFTLIELLKEE